MVPVEIAAEGEIAVGCRWVRVVAQEGGDPGFVGTFGEPVLVEIGYNAGGVAASQISISGYIATDSVPQSLTQSIHNGNDDHCSTSSQNPHLRHRS